MKPDLAKQKVLLAKCFAQAVIDVHYEYRVNISCCADGVHDMAEIKGLLLSVWIYCHLKLYRSDIVICVHYSCSVQIF